MKLIDTILKQIVKDLEYDYLRASTLEQANILSHYTNNAKGIAIYTGYGEIATTFEGAATIDKVDVQVYCLVKHPSIDATTEQLDIAMESMKQLTADIILNFPDDIVEYNLAPVEVTFDDLFTGYLLEFSPNLDGNVCSS